MDETNDAGWIPPEVASFEPPAEPANDLLAVVAFCQGRREGAAEAERTFSDCDMDFEWGAAAAQVRVLNDVLAFIEHLSRKDDQ